MNFFNKNNILEYAFGVLYIIQLVESIPFRFSKNKSDTKLSLMCVVEIW